MSEILASKYRRRYFVTGGLITLLALGLLRFLLIPHLAGTDIPSFAAAADSILDKLFVALLASIIATLFVIWLVPPTSHTAIMDIVEPARIREVLEEGHQNTLEWYYKGAVGRHFRAVTLPALVVSARKRNVIIKVTALILDPRKVPDFFGLNRSRLLTAVKGKPWTEELLTLELYASIVCIYAAKAQESSLEITVALMDTLGVFRIDLATNLVAITTEGHLDFGLRCDAGTPFYKAFREELLLTVQRAYVLPKIKGIPTNDLSVENTKALLFDLGFDKDHLTDAQILRVISFVRSPKNPYG